jgi:hypothetical protein
VACSCCASVPRCIALCACSERIGVESDVQDRASRADAAMALATRELRATAARARRGPAWASDRAVVCSFSSKAVDLSASPVRCGFGAQLHG